MSKYTDPENKDAIINSLSTLRTIGNVKAFIDATFPGWIVTSIDNYSIDYPHLRSNWAMLATMSNAKPTQVVIVDEMTFNDEHTIIQHFAELLTHAGFSVRSKLDYFPCFKCGNAIPNKVLHGHFVAKGLNVPSAHLTKCSNC